MSKLYLALLVGLLATPMASSVVAQARNTELPPLDNKDVVYMVQSHLSPETIIRVIRISPCTFDTFPSILREMRRRGVPDVVMQAMVEAPYGPSMANTSTNDLDEQPIYHYAEQLRQMGFLTPVASGRRVPTRQSRTRVTRTRQRY